MSECGREARYNGGVAICDKAAGHVGAHAEHWTDRDGKVRVNISWTHEKNGAAMVSPHTPGAVKVTS